MSKRFTWVDGILILIMGLILGALICWDITTRHRPEVTQWATHSSGHGPIIWYPAEIRWNGAEYEVNTTPVSHKNLRESMSGEDFEAVRNTVEDQLKAATSELAALREEVVVLTFEGAEKDARILELSTDLHIYDAIAGEGVRADGTALRKRIEVLETFVKNGEHLQTCASRKVKQRRGHYGYTVYHDCDCGYEKLIKKTK